MCARSIAFVPLRFRGLSISLSLSVQTLSRMVSEWCLCMWHTFKFAYAIWMLHVVQSSNELCYSHSLPLCCCCHSNCKCGCGTTGDWKCDFAWNQIAFLLLVFLPFPPSCNIHQVNRLFYLKFSSESQYAMRAIRYIFFLSSSFRSMLDKY